MDKIIEAILKKGYLISIIKIKGKYLCTIEKLENEYSFESKMQDSLIMAVKECLHEII